MYGAYLECKKAGGITLLFRRSSGANIFSHPYSTNGYHTNPTKKNIVIFILESFGKEAIGGYNKDLDGGSYKGYTPFIDSLMQHSLVYENSFANGRKSIDAIPSILASIPNGHNPFVLTPYASDSVQGLPQILKEEGYHASFFMAGPMVQWALKQ